MSNPNGADLTVTIEVMEQEVEQLRELKQTWGAIAGRELALALTNLQQAVQWAETAKRLIDDGD